MQFSSHYIIKEELKMNDNKNKNNKNKKQTKTLEQIDKEFEEDFWQTQVLGIPLK